MDYKQIAQNILDNVGGADNVRDASHCFTRLRLVLKDPSKASKDVVSKLEGVIQVVEAGGQFQVVLGGKVNKVYAEFLPLANVNGDEGEAIVGDKGSVANTILQTISKIFTPIVPAIAASGLIKGLLSAAQKLGWIEGTNSTYIILLAASNVIFYFMPIFLAYTTADALKCSKVMAMMLGAFLCYPAVDTLVQDVATKSTIFGLPVIKTAFTIGDSTKVFSYTESVIPIILSVIALSFLEKGLERIIPEMLQVILVPGLSLIIMLPVMLTVLGPVGAWIGYGIQWLYNLVMGVSPLFGGAVVGGLWGVFVIFGAHRALLPVGLNDVAMSASDPAHSIDLGGCGAGHNTLMCYAGAANFSQAGAALGVMLKTKSKKLRQVAGAATISAFLVGITEPAIYGCNLRKKRPMVCAVICGALGGAIMGLGKASNHGFANNGILTIPTYQCAANTTGQFIAFLIGIAVAFFGAAILTYIVGFEDDKDEELKVN